MERLAREGIETEIGALRAEAEAANRLWLTAMRLGRPTVVVKAAVSLDGRIALPSGESQWITGERARAQGRKLRAELGAVLVGRATAVQDDPSLTARIRGVRNEPKRFVLDPSRRVPDGAKLFQDPEGAVRVVGPGFAGNAQDLEIAATQGRLDLAELLVRMWARGITGLLVEGGARTIAWFFESGFVDRVDLFVAPRILGAGPAWVEGLQNGAIARSPSFEGPRVRRIGEDLWLQAWAAHKE
jgi:diaminohydroxyphosphoribosylaminopyrimidine deaminase/5-amino-6-(5-phosphoribosylamino)uracil reductase